MVGVKCVLEQFRDNATNFRREVLVLALQLFNKCIRQFGEMLRDSRLGIH